MSDRNDNDTQQNNSSDIAAEASAPVSAAAPAGDALDDIEGIDFLLEEIENKIAPLALA